MSGKEDEGGARGRGACAEDREGGMRKEENSSRKEGREDEGRKGERERRGEEKACGG